MPHTPNIVPVNDLRQDAAAVLKRVRKSGQPVVITQRGRAAAVVVSLEEYERSEKERHMLRLIAKGEKDIEAGAGHSLEQVLSDIDVLLGDPDH